MNFCISGSFEGTKKILNEQGIISKSIFYSLREEHFERLLPKLTLGQHAVLLKLWDSGCTTQWRSGEREEIVLL